MNKELTKTYLYNTLEFGLMNKKDMNSYFPRLLKNDEFKNMIMCKPYNPLRVQESIYKSKNASNSINEEVIRYIAFLFSEFLDKVDIPINKVSSYFNVNDIIENFAYYHSQNVDDVIFTLITKYNEKYKLRKMSKMSFIGEVSLFENLYTLYPIKSFNKFELLFDLKMLKEILVKDNEVVFYTDNYFELMNNVYFVQKYCVGNKLYCFTTNEKMTRNVTSTTFFVIKDDCIELIEPNGSRHKFLYSN